MLLGPSPLPAAAAYFKDAFMRPLGASSSDVSRVDWANKAAVVQWIREQGKSARTPGLLLEHLPYASLPPAILADLDVGLAVAEIEPAALARLSPALLENVDIAKRALAADRTSHRMFASDVLRQISPPPRRFAADSTPLSELDQALEAVRARPLALGELSLAMRNNPEVVTAAAAGDPAALAYASEKFWVDAHFMMAHLPSSSEAVARVLGKLVQVHGDAGAAKFLANHHVATLICQRANVDSLPPTTREVVDKALATTTQRRHPLAQPRRPSPFPEG